MIKQLVASTAVAVSAVMSAGAEDQASFKNMRAAYSAFVSTTNAAVRQTAYAYARGAETNSEFYRSCTTCEPDGSK